MFGSVVDSVTEEGESSSVYRWFYAIMQTLMLCREINLPLNARLELHLLFLSMLKAKIIHSLLTI